MEMDDADAHTLSTFAQKHGEKRDALLILE